MFSYNIIPQPHLSVAQLFEVDSNIDGGHSLTMCTTYLQENCFTFIDNKHADGQRSEDGAVCCPSDRSRSINRADVSLGLCMSHPRLAQELLHVARSSLGRGRQP